MLKKNPSPYYGNFGGMFVPELLVPALLQLEQAFLKSQKDSAFKAQLNTLLTTYAGRPTPLTLCHNLTAGLTSRI